MNKTLKKLLVLTGIMLAFCMLLSVGIFADGEDEGSTETVVAKIGDTEYTDLKAAITAVPEGGTVTLVSDFTAPDVTGSVYMDAGGTKSYTIEGDVKSRVLNFTNKYGLWGKTSITFKNITVRTNGELQIGDTLNITFSDDAVLTGPLDTKTVSTAGGYGYARAFYGGPQVKVVGSATVTLESGSTVYWMHGKRVFNVGDYGDGPVLNVNGAKFDSIVMDEATGGFVHVMGNGKVNCSGATFTSCYKGQLPAVFYIEAGSGSFTGEIAGFGADWPLVKAASADMLTIADAASLTQRGGTDNTYYSANYVSLTKDGTTAWYNGLQTAVNNVAKNTSAAAYTENDYTINMYKDFEISTVNGISERSFTLIGNGKTVTLKNSVAGIYDSSCNGTVVFKNVTVCSDSLGIGGKTTVVFDEGAVLSTAGEVKSTFSNSSGGTIKFKTGSKIKDVNCTSQVLGIWGSSKLYVESGVTLEGTNTIPAQFIGGDNGATVELADGSLAGGYVARVGNTYLSSFYNAIAYANSHSAATAYILADCEYAGGIPGAMNYTVEGNGHTLTVKSGIEVAGNSSVHSAVTMNNLNIVAANSGGVVIAVSYSKLTLDKVNITQSTGITNHAVLNVTGDYSEINITDSTIKNINLSTSDEQTGIIKMINGSKLYMKDSEISGNTGQNNAGVSLYSTASFEMDGGSIKNNSAKKGAGIRYYGSAPTVTFKGGATVIGNTLISDDSKANNIVLEGGKVILAEGFTGKIGLCSGGGAALGENTEVGTITGAVKGTDTVTADNTSLFAYAKEGKLYMIKKPDLTVTTDSGVYAKGAKGVIRAMSTFTNTTDGTVIEACGTYFVKTAPTAGDSTKTSQWSIENVAASNGKGFQADLEAITDLEQSIVAVSWYKLSGVDEYIYVIGSAVTVDATNTVEYTEA